MRPILIALGLTMAALSGPALAQSSILASQATDPVIRGLVAQYENSLIRERRLADDREMRLIADAEARLAHARVRADARLSGAQAVLEEARADYAALVSQIALRDAAVRVEIDAYRLEALGLAQRASPDLLAAYQRFADGDRVGAWPVIESLTQAQVNATIAAAGVRAAEPIRSMAVARQTMRYRREATAADVLRLWDQASMLDPAHSQTHSERAQLLLAMRRVVAAEAAALRARAAASADLDRYRAASTLVLVAKRQEDKIASFAYGQDELRLMYRAGPCSRGEKQLGTIFQAVCGALRFVDRLGPSLNSIPELAPASPPDDTRRTSEDLEAARSHYEDKIAIARADTTPEARSNLARALDDAGDAFWASSDRSRAVALWREALAIRRILLAESLGADHRRRDACATMAKLARGDGGVTWAEVAAEVALIEYLMPFDREGLAEFHARAGQTTE